MSVFNKKPRYPFSEVIKGLQYAVNSAQDMLQAHQIQSLSKFWNKETNCPYTQKVKVGDNEIEIPLVAMVPHNQLLMDEVEITFNAKVGSVLEGALEGDEQPHANLQMELEGVKTTDSDVMHITIRFKSTDATEGVARIVDEYNKLI
jgi:hypothetical protein